MSDNLEYGQNPPEPTNAAAIVSVISGLLLCVPGTGLIAVPTGLLGLRRHPRIGGAGLKMARVGLVLGMVNLVIWASMIAGAYGTHRTYQMSKPAFEPTKKFIMLVGSGNITAARVLCTDAVTDEKLTATAEDIQKWGAIEKMNIASGGEYHGPGDIEISSEMQFERASKILITHWANTNGQVLLTSYEFHDPPITQPSNSSPTTNPS